MDIKEDSFGRSIIRNHLKNMSLDPSMRSPALRAVEDSTRRGSLTQDERALLIA